MKDQPYTIPIIFIVFIYSKLIYIVESKRKMKTKQRMSSNTLSRVNSNNKLSTSMVKGVVICLFVCYIPYLAWWQYSMVIYRVGGNRYINCKIVVKSGEVRKHYWYLIRPLIINIIHTSSKHDLILQNVNLFRWSLLHSLEFWCWSIQHWTRLYTPLQFQRSRSLWKVTFYVTSK